MNLTPLLSLYFLVKSVSDTVLFLSAEVSLTPLLFDPPLIPLSERAFFMRLEVSLTPYFSISITCNRVVANLN